MFHDLDVFIWTYYKNQNENRDKVNNKKDDANSKGAHPFFILLQLIRKDVKNKLKFHVP